MENASSIFFNLIHDYASPLLEAAGYQISPLGFIEDFKGNKIFYQNQKYVEGSNDPQNPPFIYPMVPIDDKGYLNIKATPEYELFNPFQTFKHTCIILLKIKKLLIPFVISKAALAMTEEEDYDSKFDNCLQVYNKRDEHGDYEVGITNCEDPANPKEVMKYSSESVIKSVWGLCVEIYNNFYATKELKQFKNIDRSWNKTQKLCEEWDKARRGLVLEVKNEQENISNPDMVDFSNDNEDENLAFFDNYKYVEMKDNEDVNDEGLQNYLTSMFPQEQLIPYEEPVLDDEEKELSVEEEDKNVPIQQQMIQDNIEKAELAEKAKEEEQVEQSSHRSVFSMRQQPQQVQQQPNMFNPMMGGFGMGGFGMNPMMGNMNGFGQLPATNLDNMDLSNGNYVNPFAAYQ